MSRLRLILLSFVLLSSCQKATETTQPVPPPKPKNQKKVDPASPVANQPTSNPEESLPRIPENLGLRPASRMALPDPTLQLPDEKDLNPTVNHRPGSLTITPPVETPRPTQKP